VFLEGLTLRLPLVPTLPIPLIDRLVVQLLRQLRVLELPATMDPGRAEMLTDGQTTMFPASGAR
jgi:hypothetical protein